MGVNSIMKKIISILVLTVCTVSLLTGCKKVDSASGDTSGVHQNMTGKITMAGSSSMEKFCSAINEALMREYPNIRANAEYTGSGAGIEAVSAGTVEIGNSSRALKEEEKAAGIVENIVALDGIAVITSRSNPVSSLTKEQLISIYDGSVNNWRNLGGKDEPIVVIGREAGSGTRGAFEELLGLENRCRYVQEVDSTGGVVAKVSNTKGAIGYVSLDVLNDSVLALKLDGVAANEENIRSGKYFLNRPFIMATKGEISAQSKEVQALFQFIESKKGQEILKKVGLVPPK